MPTLVIVLAIVALEFALSFWLASYLDDTVGLGRGSAVVMVSGLYAANLVGRLLASHFARTTTTERLLAASLIAGLVGVAILLAAGGAGVAAAGIAVTGMGVGAMFPLASSSTSARARATPTGRSARSSRSPRSGRSPVRCWRARSRRPPGCAPGSASSRR